MTTASVGASRLLDDIVALARIGRGPDGGISRPALGGADLEARRWLIARMIDAGLAARLDPAGNVVGRLDPSPGHASAAAVVIGSHLDTVPGGGPLDGALGVLAGLEVARRLRESRAVRRYPLDVVAFSDEEGRFGDYVGSRAFAGALALDRVPDMRDGAGVRFEDALVEAALSPAALAAAARDAGTISAYLELHIEQGPVLETEGAVIGIVERIVGQERFTIEFEGRPDHAGTTPLAYRRDAFAAAALFATRLRARVLAEAGHRAVMTIGAVRVEPGVGNVVPGFARLAVDIRDLETAGLARLSAMLLAEAEAAAAEHRVASRVRRLDGSPPVPLDTRLQGLIEHEAGRLGLRHLRLPSGAGHDAKILASRVPAAMIFVPSVEGRSHCREERTAEADIEAGVAVLHGVAADLLAHDGARGAA